MALILASLACTLTALPASASPTLPYVLNGVISMSGQPVPDQLLLEAKINQVTYAATYTRSGGFGLDPVFKIPADQLETERVEGGRDGDLVELYLDGVKVADTVFQSGRVNRLVIEVGDHINAPPTAFFMCMGGAAGYSMRFDGSESKDPEGDTLTYSWDFGDGHTSTLVKPIHTYETDGEYAVTLQVQDKYGSTGKQSQTVEVKPLPEPEYWQLINLDAAASESYYSDETWLKIHVQSVEPTHVTVVRYDEVFMSDDSVTLSAQQLWSLSVLEPQTVSYPLYIEIPVTDIGEVPPNTMFYTWRDGGWSACPQSGASDERVWAYISEGELGEGLIALGLSDGYVRLDLQGVHGADEQGEYVCSLDLTSVGFAGDYRVHLRVDGKLLSIETVSLTRGGTASLEIAFTAASGTHLVSVNGVEEELRVASLLNNLFIVGLGLVPVSLISTLIRRNL
ncbi:PKD domain-containing protein [Candidatus Bathyarchaeota archaeon]|nr:PKD domain-containing protein [Candidatus Bathyarchaeota archaeon]